MDQRTGWVSETSLATTVNSGPRRLTISDLGLGDAEADAAAAAAALLGPPYKHKSKPGSIPPSTLTGVNELALAFGRNDDALTLSRATGDMLPFTGGTAPFEVEEAPFAVGVDAIWTVFLPLNGGMGWMTIAGFLAGVSDEGIDLTVEEPFVAAVEGVATGLVLVLAAGGSTGREDAALILAAAT